MLFKKIYFILSFSFVYANEEEVSAYRDLNLPFSFYENLILNEEKNSKYSGLSVISMARHYTRLRLPGVTNWESVVVLKQRFFEIRNKRFLKWGRRPEFLRRIPWLYPNDGCYGRAAVANKIFRNDNVPVPNKVFDFGRLRVKTKNAPWGVVGWWYHVAPIVGGAWG